MENEKKKSVFETLNAVNCNGHTETKTQGGVKLTYLSWAWAWAEVKKRYPKATYTIYENRDGLNYHHDERTAWVKTGVTIEGEEAIEYLPVMDYRNQSIPLDKLTSFDVNKAIQRSLTKACARHGLGLYIYAGEDLPEEPTPTTPKRAATAQSVAQPKVLSATQKRDIAMRVMESNVELLNQSLKYFNRADWNELTNDEWVKIYDSCAKKGLVS